MSVPVLGLSLSAALLGCSNPPACVDHGDCAAGEGCLGGSCEAVECVSSESCDLRSFCDLNSYTCRDGCEEDADCVAGELCDTEVHQCAPYGCRDTQLDCYYNEVCVQSSGWCELDPDPHCKPCTSDAVCGEGNCFQFDTAAQTYCLLYCDSNEDCPRGYECADAAGDGTLYCTAWCPTYDELGYLPW